MYSTHLQEFDPDSRTRSIDDLYPHHRVTRLEHEDPRQLALLSFWLGTRERA